MIMSKLNIGLQFLPAEEYIAASQRHSIGEVYPHLKEWSYLSIQTRPRFDIMYNAD